MKAMVESTTTAQIAPGGVRLQCPRCGASLREPTCAMCGFMMREENGIWLALPEERVVHYAQFIRDYERIRVAEGRSSASAEFYLSLPYKDLSRRNSGQWAIRAHTFDYLLRRLLPAPERDGSTRVLDIGAGNGWMSYRLMRCGYEPTAVDLLTNHEDGLGAAEHCRSSVGTLFPRFRAESSSLPFAADQFDVVLFNASFHYSESYSESFGEALRCARPGGFVIISDTPWYRRNESGQQMVAERHARFRQRYGTASDSIKSLEYLTDERLDALARKFSIQWTKYAPWYGFGWAMRPVVAKLRGRREPSRFHIYVARKNA